MTAPGSRPARPPGRRELRPVQVPPPLLLPLLLLLLLAAAGPARGWESGDLELFDLVEEVQLNFYQFLGVQQVSGAPARPAAAAPGQNNVRVAAQRRGWGGSDPVPPREPAPRPGSALLGSTASSPGPGSAGLGRNCSQALAALLPFSGCGLSFRLDWGAGAQGLLPSLSSALGGNPTTPLCRKKKEEWCVGKSSHVSL